jgi:hypothetical protein
VKKYLLIIALLFVVIGTPCAHATPTTFTYVFQIFDATSLNLNGVTASFQTGTSQTVDNAFDTGTLTFAPARPAGSGFSTPTFTCDDPLGCAGGTPTAPDVMFPSPTTITETWNGFTVTIPLSGADATHPFPDAPGDMYSFVNVAFSDSPTSGVTPEPATWIYAITAVLLGVLLTKLKVL